MVWAVAGSLAIRRCRTSRTPTGTSVVAVNAPSESSSRAVSLMKNGLPPVRIAMTSAVSSSTGRVQVARINSVAAAESSPRSLIRVGSRAASAARQPDSCSLSSAGR